MNDKLSKTDIRSLLDLLRSNSLFEHGREALADAVEELLNGDESKGLKRSSLSDLSPQLERTHIQDVTNIAMALLPLHEAKEKTYRLSFAKRGEAGCWMNLGRKYDRINGLVEKVLVEDQEGVTLVDTLADLAIYSLKWLAVIKVIRRDDLRDWVLNTYQKDTGMPPGKALGLFGLKEITDRDVILASVRKSMKESLEVVEEISAPGDSEESFRPPYRGQLVTDDDNS